MNRMLLHTVLGRIRHGRLELRDRGRVHHYGPPDAELRAVVTMHSPKAWRAWLRGSTGMAESYADGLWDCDDPVVLVRIAAREMRRYDGVRRALVPLQQLAAMVPRNSRLRARKHIAAHYDLGDRLFELFLDDGMTYSSALFEDESATLEEAQEAKLDQICRRLELKPDDHVLEIGSGWGSLSLHAASNYGCRVTTATISEAQHARTVARVREAGLENQVDVVLSDYRDLRGGYDKLVSVEMIEAVGRQYFKLFFERCSELLHPEGLMLLQAILIEDDAYDAEKASRSFINKLIFPGGCLPSMRVIERCLDATGLASEHVDDLTHSYVLTLRHWRERFRAAADQAAAHGYDLRFRRLWELYLNYVEAGFTERRIEDVQLLIAGPRYRGSRVNMRPEIASSRKAGPREASLARAVLPPGPST
jgi:cyclopropane-fatty-acyl-phospholipid synthase